VVLELRTKLDSTAQSAAASIQTLNAFGVDTWSEDPDVQSLVENARQRLSNKAWMERTESGRETLVRPFGTGQGSILRASFHC
jgi:hypothetical protein